MKTSNSVRLGIGLLVLLVVSAVFLGILLSGKVLADDAMGNPSNTVLSPVRIATLKSIAVEDGKLVFSAKSHGCTNSEDFRLLLDGPDLMVIRINPDLCRKMPQWKQYALPLNDPELREWHELYVSNPMALEW